MKELEVNLKLLGRACFRRLYGASKNAVMKLKGLYKFASMQSVANKKQTSVKIPHFSKYMWPHFLNYSTSVH
jgi:hypothetical protein